MSRFEVHVEEVVRTTYIIEAEDKCEIDDILADGDHPSIRSKNLSHEVVKVIKLEDV
jgi:hypothetical protein